jgi:hypothetical protein
MSTEREALDVEVVEDNSAPVSSLYSKDELETLKYIETLQMETIQKLTEEGVSTDEDDIAKLLALSKEVTANIHRKVANESKHDIGTSQAESQAVMAERAHEIQSRSAKAIEDNAHLLGVNTVPDSSIPENTVPGHMDIEITRPSFKEVMSAVDPDEEDD